MPLVSAATRVSSARPVRDHCAAATLCASTDRSNPATRYRPGSCSQYGGQPPARAPTISSVAIAAPSGAGRAQLASVVSRPSGPGHSRGRRLRRHSTMVAAASIDIGIYVNVAARPASSGPSAPMKRRVLVPKNSAEPAISAHCHASRSRVRIAVAPARTSRTNRQSSPTASTTSSHNGFAGASDCAEPPAEKMCVRPLSSEVTGSAR